MKTFTFETPLGKIRATADDRALHFLNFDDSNDQDFEWGQNQIIDGIEKELSLYFKGQLKKFKTPFALRGTAFQKKVWNELFQIPFGKMISYSQLAQNIGHPKAARACGNANGVNPLVIIIPCHRVIHSNGGLGGYNCGLEKKQWLLKHESIVSV